MLLYVPENLGWIAISVRIARMLLSSSSSEEVSPFAATKGQASLWYLILPNGGNDAINRCTRSADRIAQNSEHCFEICLIR